MLIKAEDSRHYLSLFAETISQHLPDDESVKGYRYEINGTAVTGSPAMDKGDNFASTSACLFDEWVETEALFGCIRQQHQQYSLSPGLIHKANGGVLILSIRTLLAQPLLWFRLKQVVTSQCFRWVSPDENRPLPLNIPPMPLDLRVILVGDRSGLGDFQELEPELVEQALYAEFEPELRLDEPQDMSNWCAYVNTLASSLKLPPLSSDAYPILLTNAVRYTGDQFSLPIAPVWISQQLMQAKRYHDDEPTLTADMFTQAINDKFWRESYLLERVKDDVEQGQIRIETEGYVIGQINGLSVLEYPGHPRAFGEPSRISCVVHVGDGEIMDVERKAELGGNLHAKGMMIMQAFISSELAAEQQLPFSASIVFEQSYGEVDGDSASLAELCALFSALSQQPIDQQIGVTGSVDQFGNVQPIGGINEKVEAFFDVCNNRGLTGTQGIILPYSNLRHLCLKAEVVEAVKAEQFHLWYVEHVAEALPILTRLPYDDEQNTSLLSLIQDRIDQAVIGNRHRTPWMFRWLNWFNRG